MKQVGIEFIMHIHVGRYQVAFDYSFIYYFLFLSGLKKWVEIGNSGIFRPEMLLPMGLPENVSVIAWGLSLERYWSFNL